MTDVHFDLRQYDDADGMRVTVHGDDYELIAHDLASLTTAAAQHPVLAALTPDRRATFTHYADIPASGFASPSALRFVQVTRPPAADVHLAEVVLIATILPEATLRAFYQRRFELAEKSVDWLRAMHRHNLRRAPRLHAAKLAWLGLDELPREPAAALELLLSAETLVTAIDTAKTLVFHHPDLANVEPNTAAIVLNDHVLPDPEVDPEQYNAIQVLAAAISQAGDSWSPVVPCKDHVGNPLKAGYALKDGDGGFEAGQQLYTFSLAAPVQAAAAAPTAGARRSAADDLRLAGKCWAPTPGTSVLPQPAATVGTADADAVADVAFKWTVNERTNHHGVSVDKGSIQVDNDGTFSIEASNCYLRTLYAAYELLDDTGKPIGSKELLYSVSATNTIMGIPTPTDPTVLTFSLNDAAAVRLYFGSLGTTDWDDDVSWRGALLTVLWQYGIPVAFLVAGKALTSTSLFNKIVKRRELVAAAIEIARPILGDSSETDGALPNTTGMLTTAADAILTLVVQKGLETLGKWLIEQVGSGALSSAFGPVGWMLRLASSALDVAELAETTGEVLSSPACITITASRAIDVTLTLHPDPRHGEAGHPETAVWPSVATVYEATLQYKDGTCFAVGGQLPATTSGTPIALRFADVPAGGTFRILAGVYSSGGWLAGAWQSDWLTARPTAGTTLALGDESITERLVPLAPDTQYVFKERIVDDHGVLSWVAGGQPPAAPVTALDCGASGTLCELVGISLNNSAFQVGYAWRASGQDLPPDDGSAAPSSDQLYAVQNLSVLATPSRRLKTSGIGLRDRPAIAYAPSLNPGKEIDDTNFVVDPRGGGMNLRRVALDDNRTTFGLEDPGLQSWGALPLENVDAAAVHPSSTVIACSWHDSKLMLLDLPQAPTADAKAPGALLVSGEGLRQGLMQGPRALAVAPDGRILVLESLNRRVQAFDTKGNPVPSFTPGPVRFMVATATIAAELDAGKVPDRLQAAFAQSGVTFVGALDASFVARLDSATFQPHDDPLLQALAILGVTLAYDPAAMGDPAASAQIAVVQHGSGWTVTDPRGPAWNVALVNGKLHVTRRLTKVDVRVEHAGERWLIVEHTAVGAWRLVQSTGSPGQTEVRECLSFFNLRAPRVGTMTYLDMAVESQGYVYVLAHGANGAEPGDYVLDVYGPDGRLVLRTPDPSVTAHPQNVVAGKLAVDIWRDVYALTYEVLHAPGPQPGLAHWMPTPPLFGLSLSTQPDFNDENIGAVARDFASHDIQLSTQAFITIDDRDGAWQVKDGDTIYYVYRSGDGLQVFDVPA